MNSKAALNAEVSSSSERWFVVKAEPCQQLSPNRCPWGCNGCMGDGLRVRPDSAVEVEHRAGVVAVWDPMGHSRRACWVATERTEQ